jgi:hypothetical protein
LLGLAPVILHSLILSPLIVKSPEDPHLCRYRQGENQPQHADLPFRKTLPSDLAAARATPDLCYGCT